MNAETIEMLKILSVIILPPAIAFLAIKLSSWADTYDDGPQWLDMAMKNPPKGPYCVAYNPRGLRNSWSILVFDSFRSKIDFVRLMDGCDDDEHRHLAVPIPTGQIRDYMPARPNNEKGEYFGIVEHESPIPHCVGYVAVCQPGSGHARVFETIF